MQTRVTEKLRILQSKTLELIAHGEQAAKVADFICAQVGDLQTGSLCTIVTVDNAGRLHPLAPSGLPDSYRAALDGLLIGPMVGSCGAAAFFGVAVETTDIAADPRWSDFGAVVLPMGLKACWSSPIKARDGRTLGAFAFYHDQPRSPTDIDREIVALCVQLCAIALEHQAMIEQLQQSAYTDALSQLPNRASFNKRLQTACETQQTFGLVILDLDHLKVTNDSLGHQAGDQMIRAVAARLAPLAQAEESFRLGGDEFGVIVSDVSSVAELAKAGEYLVGLMEQPVEYAGHSLPCFVTAGGALFCDVATSAQELLQNADIALYHGKSMKRGSFVVFDEGMRTAITRRISIVATATDAVAHKRILPHYQPIVRMDTGDIIGVEALARIRNPSGDVLSAGAFGEAFQDSRLAYAITGVMLTEVATDLRRWLDIGIPFQHVGFNVTTTDFQKGDLVERLSKAFGERHVGLEHVILEVNEDVFLGYGDTKIARSVELLRDKGIRVALDDFGTGYASMTQLLDFPVDIVKIEQSFVSRIMNDERSAIIVEALIQLAGRLDVRVVAEGVETSLQADRLMQMGCRLGQGYLYSRPVPSSDAEELLQKFAQGRSAPNIRIKSVRTPII